MNAPEKGEYNVFEEVDESYFFETHKKILSKEDQKLLLKIVRCSVCLEVPKGKEFQLRSCIKGHHFCSTCHNKLKQCALCRGKLCRSRNFAVEEVISKLGVSLGLTKPTIVPDSALQPVYGKYKCLHQCSVQLQATKMLQHIRTCHSLNLIDNFRSNPYTKKFHYVFEVSFLINTMYSLSAQISDLGLFTVVINIDGNFLIGSIHSLQDNLCSSLCKFTLTAKVRGSQCLHEFSVAECAMFDYKWDILSMTESKRCLKVKTADLVDLLSGRDSLDVYFCIWKNSSEEEDSQKSNLLKLSPQVPIMFVNDRNSRRNQQRNLRKRKLKYKLKNTQTPEENITKRMNSLQLETN